MNDTDSVRVNETLYVNEATLELLRRRIESQVKGSFFRTIGAPIGGAGLLAILYVLFVWIPDNLAGFIEKVPNFQQTLETATVTYLNDDASGRQFVREQINAVADDLIKSAVNAELQSADVQDFIQAQVHEHTTKYFNSEIGQELVSTAVTAVMRSPEIRQQISQAIDKALRPAVAGLSIRIEDDLAALVRSIEPIRSTTVGKADIPALDRFFDEQRDDILQSGRTVILSKRVGGAGRYDSNVIDLYFRRLIHEFDSQFTHVLLEFHDGRYLGLVDRDMFHAQIWDVLPLLNSRPSQLSYESASRDLNRLFGPQTLQYVRGSATIREALTVNAWQVVGLNSALPVVDEEGRFAGLTDRRKLLGSLSG